MKELSLHILDIAQNSLSAGASLVEMLLEETSAALSVTIRDDGRGMTQELVRRVLDPFTTTRTTRKVGMGLPLFKLAAEQTGGTLDIESAPGEGTVVRAIFQTGSIDIPPLGDMAGTLVTLVSGAPDVDFVYRYMTDGNLSELDTRELRAVLEDVALDTPEVLAWIRDSLREAENKQ